MSYTTLNRFRKTAFWEGVSFLLLLFIAMPIKYGLGNPIPVKIVGMAHGILFIAYVIFLIQAAMEYNWSIKKSVLAFIAALLPFGPFIFDRRLGNELAQQVPANEPVN